MLMPHLYKLNKPLSNAKIVKMCSIGFRVGLVFLLCFTFLGLFSFELSAADAYFPLPLSAYHDQHLQDLQSILLSRIEQEPFNLLASVIFFLALVHIFLTGSIARFVERLKKKELQKQALEGKQAPLSVKVAFLQLISELEVVFAFWVVILGIFFVYFINWESFLHYLEYQVSFTEPAFIVVIMAMCITKPVRHMAEQALTKVSLYFIFFFKTKAGSLWFVALFFGSILGSLITEPAAITIVALMLSQHFFPLTKNQQLKYLTLAILLFNISLGGSLTNFSAPPILVVAKTWGITTPYIFSQVGLPSLGIIFMVTLAGLLLFYKEFKRIDKENAHKQEISTEFFPRWVGWIHLIFIAWVVFNAHHGIIFIGSFLFFLGFLQTTKVYQSRLDLKGPLLTGLFLAGLVVHGGLQSWWLEPLLVDIKAHQVFFMSIFLTSFNDNAAVTYLASLLPSFSVDLRLAVLSGALTGGGLTVMANAPNPTAFQLLAKHFPGQRIDHFQLFLYALPLLAFAILFFLLWL